MALTGLRSDDLGKLIVRLAVGGMMLFHGVHKILHGVGWMADLLASHGLPGPIAYGSYVGEVVAPILILVGFLTRPAALVVAFTMVIAVWLALLDKLFTLTPQGGWAIELNALFFLGALALVFMGAGRFSLSRGRGMWD